MHKVQPCKTSVIHTSRSLIFIYLASVGAYNRTMKQAGKLSVLGLAAVIIAFAASPVARVISAQEITVDGIVAPARNFVPLALGNEVTTTGAPATIQFADGTAVTLQPRSQLRIETQPSGARVRVLSGYAIFDVARTPHAAPAVPANQPGVATPPGATLPANPAGRGGSYQAPVTTSSRDRSPIGRSPRTPAPPAAGFTGTLVIGGAPAGSGIGAQIIGPTGLTVNLTAVVNPTTGATTYVVSSIQQTVTTPTGATAVVVVTSGTMIGATVGGIGTPGTFTFTPAGSTTPLTAQQTNTAIQTGVQQAVTTGVTNGTLPVGTAPPAPSPVGTGQFSASGG